MHPLKHHNALPSHPFPYFFTPLGMRRLRRLVPVVALVAAFAAPAEVTNNRMTLKLNLGFLSSPPPQSSTTSIQTTDPEKDTRLSDHRRIVESFKASRFQPDGMGIVRANCHVQTILGTGALAGKIFGDPKRPFSITSRRIETPDGDFFDIEYCDDINDSEDVVIILHGLEGTSRSAAITNTAVACKEKGFSCILFNFRGCSGEENRTPGGYHVGFTQDLTQLIDLLHAEHPQKRIYLTGTSLGGNVILKYLGEQGSQARDKKVYGAAVACVPFDPKTCQSKLDVGLSRAIYSENFLETLKRKGEVQIARFPGAFDIEAVRAAKTVGDFDDAFIAKIYGFADKFDYYERSGSIRYLSRIRVPTVAINAIDDPFIDEAGLPKPEEDVKEASVRLIYHPRGGHCGFAFASRMSPEVDAPAVPKHGWLAEEFSRALKHIRDESLLLESNANTDTTQPKET